MTGRRTKRIKFIEVLRAQASQGEPPIHAKGIGGKIKDLVSRIRPHRASDKLNNFVHILSDNSYELAATILPTRNYTSTEIITGFIETSMKADIIAPDLCSHSREILNRLYADKIGLDVAWHGSMTIKQFKPADVLIVFWQDSLLADLFYINGTKIEPYGFLQNRPPMKPVNSVPISPIEDVRLTILSEKMTATRIDAYLLDPAYKAALETVRRHRQKVFGEAKNDKNRQNEDTYLAACLRDGLYSKVAHISHDPGSEIVAVAIERTFTKVNETITARRSRDTSDREPTKSTGMTQQAEARIQSTRSMGEDDLLVAVEPDGFSRCYRLAGGIITVLPVGNGP